MAAATSLFPLHVPSSGEEPRIVPTDVPWSTYVVLRDSIESPSTRMTYLEGTLEIMSPSREHEVDKTQIARLLELADREIPDIALEVIATHGAIDKLDVYRGLGIREVWLFESGAFRVLTLRGDTYEPTGSSEVIPEVDLARIAHFASQRDQHEALRAFRAELRG